MRKGIAGRKVGRYHVSPFIGELRSSPQAIGPLSGGQSDLSGDVAKSEKEGEQRVRAESF